MTYQIFPVDDYIAGPGNIGAFPASFRFAVASMWIQPAASSQQAAIGVSDTTVLTNAEGFGVSFDPTPDIEAHVTLGDGAQHGAQNSLAAFFFQQPTGLQAGVYTNVLLSVDSHGVAQLYVNDVAVPLNSSSIAAANLNMNAPTGTNPFSIGTGLGGTIGCLADVFIATPAAFYDLSIEQNRRPFIDGSGNPADPTTSGLTANILLRRNSASNTTTDFQTNQGTTGGTFPFFNPSPTLCDAFPVVVPGNILQNIPIFPTGLPCRRFNPCNPWEG